MYINMRTKYIENWCTHEVRQAPPNNYETRTQDLKSLHVPLGHVMLVDKEFKVYVGHFEFEY